MKAMLTTITLLALSTGLANAADCGPGQKAITRQEILAAQKSWGDGIVAIGKSSDHKKSAMAHIDKFYAYDLGPVLFKPTKASAVQFRDTKDEALSYFVGGKEKEDKGFALAPYTKVRFENHNMILGCDTALAQGNYYFSTTDGREIKVEYSFGYVEDKNGALKINLQHSSIPFKPE